MAPWQGFARCGKWGDEERDLLVGSGQVEAQGVSGRSGVSEVNVPSLPSPAFCQLLRSLPGSSASSLLLLLQDQPRTRSAGATPSKQKSETSRNCSPRPLLCPWTRLLASPVAGFPPALQRSGPQVMVQGQALLEGVVGSGGACAPTLVFRINSSSVCGSQRVGGGDSDCWKARPWNTRAVLSPPQDLCASGFISICLFSLGKTGGRLMHKDIKFEKHPLGSTHCLGCAGKGQVALGGSSSVSQSQPLGLRVRHVPLMLPPRRGSGAPIH